MVWPIAKSPPNFVRYGNPSTRKIRVAFARLVDQGRADVARLEEHRLDGILARFGGRLGHVEHALRLFGPARDIRVERHAPVDLDDVHGDQRALPRPREIAGQPDDARVGRTAAEGQHGATKRRSVQFRHQWSAPGRLG